MIKRSPANEKGAARDSVKRDATTEIQNATTELPRASLMRRLIAIGVVVGGIAGLFTYAGGWLTPHALTPARIADTFEDGQRRSSWFSTHHAKGVCVSAFREQRQGISLSKASVFQPGRVPIIGRFSLLEASLTLRTRPNGSGLGIRFRLRGARNGAPP